MLLAVAKEGRDLALHVVGIETNSLITISYFVDFHTILQECQESHHSASTVVIGVNRSYDLQHLRNILNYFHTNLDIQTITNA